MVADLAERTIDKFMSRSIHDGKSMHDYEQGVTLSACRLTCYVL